MKRKFLSIILFMWMLILLMPLISASNITHMNKVEKTSEQIESGFMVGIMHVKHIKTGWGWTDVWTPIYILITVQDERYFLGPSSGSFTPYDIDGFVGPLYYLFLNPYRSGPFFICAYVTVHDFS